MLSERNLPSVISEEEIVQNTCWTARKPGLTERWTQFRAGGEVVISGTVALATAELPLLLCVCVCAHAHMTRSKHNIFDSS